MRAARRFIAHGALIAALVALALGALPASAQDFYRGKTINLIVGNAAGGGYDIYARLLARHMGRYIPGEPSFVVRNMPGAGGMVLSNHIYAQAPRDGLTLGLMGRSNTIEPLLGNPSAKYRPEEFLWVGTPSSYEDDSYCIVIRADSPVKSIADLKSGSHALRLGGLAVGGSDTDLVLISRDVLKLNIQLIRGYRGTMYFTPTGWVAKDKDDKVLGMHTKTGAEDNLLHHVNLQNHLRNGEALNCPCELGLAGVVAVNMANESWRTSQVMGWDEKNQKMVPAHTLDLSHFPADASA